MKRFLQIVASLVLILAIAVALAWVLRSDPIGPMSGRAVTGEVMPYPEDWSFSDAHGTIAVETRPDEPHSVTTIAFVHEGALYVPATRASKKDWTRYVLEDPRVRLKIGEAVYPARAVRVPDVDPATYLASVAAKYEEFADRAGEDLPEDVWLFRIEPR